MKNKEKILIPMSNLQDKHRQSCQVNKLDLKYHEILNIMVISSIQN
jgi:hypothetical protein